jgi:hypothetical protein
MNRPAPVLISSAGDMLAKAVHDLQDMRTGLNAYTVFNFFVTCYHVMDYVKALGTVDAAEVDRFSQDPDFDVARFLCNRGKHFELRAASHKESNQVLMGAVSGIARSGAVRSGEPVRWRLYIEGTEVRPIDLADRLVLKWEQFFDSNQIPRRNGSSV